MATHSHILAWKIPRIKEPSGAPVHGVAESQTRLKHLSRQAGMVVLFVIYR